MSASAPADDVVIGVQECRKYFPVSHGILRRVVGWVKAVDGVSFRIKQGETYGLVGESGCGKTTVARMILQVEEPTSGLITFRGQDATHFSGSGHREYRASVQAVFQDPWSSLNPRMRVGSIILEPLLTNRHLSRRDAKERLNLLLEDVGLQPFHADHYPHEFSGGQRQRIALARAMSSEPALIVLDEPVSALDVSIRAQILNLLRRIQARYGVSYLLISHNLATLRYMSDHVGVMYLGKIVEEGAARDVFTNPLHPYTRGLIAASLPSHPDQRREEVVISGEVPSPLNVPAGCPFHPRCPLAMDRCATDVPVVRSISADHTVVCHLY